MRNPSRLALASAALLAAGCGTTANPEYCADNSQCVGKPGGPVCHPALHSCYPGCSSDMECEDPSSRAYSPGKPKCNIVTHECGAATPGGDGGRDAGPREAAPDAPLVDGPRAEGPRPPDGPRADRGIDRAIDLGPPPDGPKKKKLRRQPSVGRLHVADIPRVLLRPWS